MSNFEELLIHSLDAHNGKISEYQLLKYIEEKQPQFFDHLPNKSTLYQKHFWLFHLLYSLKQSWHQKRRTLNISALEISYSLSTENRQQLNDYDPLTEFYLNKDNLNLSETQIADMQKKFWQRYLALNEKADAIKTLELTGKTPLTLKDVKRHYQRLASIHHPDKGGTSEKFSSIKKAYQDLILIFQ